MISYDELTNMLDHDNLVKVKNHYMMQYISIINNIKFAIYR